MKKNEFSNFHYMEISDWRLRIDKLNEQIISLLKERALYAVEIGKIKKEKGLPVFDANREGLILDRVGELARRAQESGSPLSEISVRKIFQVIMEETRKVED